MKHLFKIASLLVLGVMVAACQQTPVPNNPQPLGLLELRLDNTGASTGQVAHARVTHRQSRGVLREADVTFTSIPLSAIQNDGAYDYLLARFSVKNISLTAFDNLTLYAVAKQVNIAGTAIKSITNFGGINTAPEQTRVAKLMTATHGLNISPTGASLIAGSEDFQAFEPSEVSALQNDPNWTSNGFSVNDKVLGYGFVARRCIPDCNAPTSFVRNFGTTPSTNQGIVTIALRIPRSSGTAYNFVMTFAVVNETTPRVTRSVYPAEPLSVAETRLTNLGVPIGGEVMQIGLARGASQSATRTNKGADVVNVSNDPTNGNSSYNALGLGRLSSGDNHTCALTASGQAYCWGHNNSGQLGNNSLVDSGTPVLVTGGYAFSSIGAGGNHTCGVTTSGAAYCWGYNGYGQLGDTTTTTSSVPVLVSGGLSFSSIDGGSTFTCGIVLNGDAYCWGSGSNGELGNAGTASSNVPVLVEGGLSFTSISAGSNHVCGITSTFTARCWGYNAYGQIGNNSTASRTIPTLVNGSLTFSSISAGALQTCGIISSGAAYCWGYNGYGQLGDGTNTNSSVPVLVSGGLTLSNISAGNNHNCGIALNGTTNCWGYGYGGELGNATNTASNVPILVSGGQAFSNISLGNSSCAITANGIVYCWGSNSYGELGSGLPVPNKNTPTQVTGNPNYSKISASDSHTCGLLSSGAVNCWGYNAYGQLGDATTINSNIPVLVSGGLTFTSIDAGDTHTCGLVSSGAAYCWGYNGYGQLGDATNTSSSVPVLVSGGLSFSSISAGGVSTCGIVLNGDVYCWGSGSNGELGNAGTAGSNVPVLVEGGLSFTSIKHRWKPHLRRDFHRCGTVLGL